MSSIMHLFQTIKLPSFHSNMLFHTSHINAINIASKTINKIFIKFHVIFSDQKSLISQTNRIHEFKSYFLFQLTVPPLSLPYGSA